MVNGLQCGKREEKLCNIIKTVGCNCVSIFMLIVSIVKTQCQNVCKKEGKSRNTHTRIFFWFFSSSEQLHLVKMVYLSTPDNLAPYRIYRETTHFDVRLMLLRYKKAFNNNFFSLAHFFCSFCLQFTWFQHHMFDSDRGLVFPFSMDLEIWSMFTRHIHIRYLFVCMLSWLDVN